MRFDIITIFPEIFDFYFKQSLLAKAREKGIIKIKAYNLRDFTDDKHKTARLHRYAKHCGQVDDKPFGGGRGMIFKPDPIIKAVEKIKQKNKKTKVILFSPRGKKLNQKMAFQLSKLDQLIMITGRYEGVDERIAKYLVDEQVSIGDYVLMSGDVPALIVVEAVARLLPWVVGKSEQLISERITKQKGFIEYPQYTRPETIEIAGKNRRAPKVLMSGNHKEIEKWRAKKSK